MTIDKALAMLSEVIVLDDPEMEAAYKLVIDELCARMWIDASIELPTDSDELVLVIVSGKPAENITLKNAVELAEYSAEEGWILESFPEATDMDVTWWMPIPDWPEGGVRT